MALRDIFDSDPRSKDQLREELRLQTLKISELNSEVTRLSDYAKFQNSAATPSPVVPIVATVTKPAQPIEGIRCENSNELIANSHETKLCCRYCGASVPPFSAKAVTVPSDAPVLVAKGEATEEAPRVRRIASGANLQGKTWQRTIDGLFNIGTSEFIANEDLTRTTVPQLGPGYSLPHSTSRTFFVPQADVNERVVAYEPDALIELSPSAPIKGDQVEQIEKTVSDLRKELANAKSVISQFPPFGTTPVNQPTVSTADLERIASLTLERDRKSTAIVALETRATESQYQMRLLEATIVGLRVELNEVKKLRAENSTLQSQLANWTQFHAEREALLSKRENIVSTKLTDWKRSHTSKPNISGLTAEEILAWMFSTTQPDDLHVDHGYLHLLGDGPWDNDAFGRLMENQNFSLWKLPDADIAHLVVGRNNWNEDDLIAQIEARQGQALRIYSQEMWFAAMATGRDPFDADDPELLQAFASGHDALEFLIGLEMPWPNVSDHPRGEVNPVEVSELGVVASPMHLMDYRVGKTSPHSEEERHAILNEIFCSRNLKFGDDCSPTYRSNWGTPKSAQRLYRMASHIKFIVDGPNGSDYRKPVAREDWINDLAWLKKTYFRKTVHAFKWPNTPVP